MRSVKLILKRVQVTETPVESPTPYWRNTLDCLGEGSDALGMHIPAITEALELLNDLGVLSYPRTTANSPGRAVDIKVSASCGLLCMW